MNKIIKFLIMAEFFFAFGLGLYGPIYSIYVLKIGGNLLDAGIASSIFLLVMATLQYPIGKMIDKHGKKPFLLATYLLTAFVLFGYIFVQNTLQLFALQIFYGVAMAMGDPSWTSWFSDSTNKKKSGSDWAFGYMAVGYAGGISALVGGAIAQFMGFSTLFTLAGIIALIAVVITYFNPEEKSARKKK